MNALVIFKILAHVSRVAAATPPTDPCAFLGGGCTASQNVIANAVPVVVDFLVVAAAGVSVVFVVWGGAQMLISFGDESAATKGRNSVVFALVGFALTMLAQVIVVFAVEQFQGIHMSSSITLQVMNSAVSAMVALFNTVFVIMMILAGFRMVWSRGGSDDFNKARSMLTWAIAGAIVVNAARALATAVLTISSNF